MAENTYFQFNEGTPAFVIIVVLLGCWLSTKNVRQCSNISNESEHCCCHTHPNYDSYSGSESKTSNILYKIFSFVFVPLLMYGQAKLLLNYTTGIVRFLIPGILLLWVFYSFRRQFMKYFGHPSRCVCVCHYTDDFEETEAAMAWHFFDKYVVVCLFTLLAFFGAWYVLRIFGIIAMYLFGLFQAMLLGFVRWVWPRRPAEGQYAVHFGTQFQ
ncbi:hypothetical protein GGR57DRAFT_507741 [Xylariaceae sp. FL1272]|nr:hypothetical protein GGR57DRAFT_507741 [Xylariaceae sp. FL1272]